jgi:hypothetical protein
MQLFLQSMLVLFLFFPLFAADAVSRGARDEEKFIQYLAGIELIDHSKNLSGYEIAEKYRELARITCLNADSARTRISRLMDKPGEWSQIRTKVLELLQKLK